MKLVGLIGLRRVGKDTAARALQDIGYRNVKFAGALKEMLRTYLRYLGNSEFLIEQMIEGDGKELLAHSFCGKSPRHAMQTLGTEWGRDLIDENIWVRAAIAHARQFEKVVISDVRFPNEVDAIRNAGGKIIKLIRDGQIADRHPSEALIAGLDFDYLITNYGTVAELQDNVKQIIPQL